METCYLAIGSNIGNRRKNIFSAIKKVNSLKQTKVIKVSSLFVTDPVGGPEPQAKFFNAAIKIRTSLSPVLLLNKLKNIECELGRVKTVKNGPRIIDLDILFFGKRKVNTKKLTIPHKELFFRPFVLGPLSEII